MSKLTPEHLELLAKLVDRCEEDASAALAIADHVDRGSPWADVADELATAAEAYRNAIRRFVAAIVEAS